MEFQMEIQQQLRESRQPAKIILLGRNHQNRSCLTHQVVLDCYLLRQLVRGRHFHSPSNLWNQLSLATRMIGMSLFVQCLLRVMWMLDWYLQRSTIKVILLGGHHLNSRSCLIHQVALICWFLKIPAQLIHLGPQVKQESTGRRMYRENFSRARKFSLPEKVSQRKAYKTLRQELRKVSLPRKISPTLENFHSQTKISKGKFPGRQKIFTPRENFLENFSP